MQERNASTVKSQIIFNLSAERRPKTRKRAAKIEAGVTKGKPKQKAGEAKTRPASQTTIGKPQIGKTTVGKIVAGKTIVVGRERKAKPTKGYTRSRKAMRNGND